MANNHDLDNALRDVDLAIAKLRFIRKHLADVYGSAYRNGGNGSEGSSRGAKEHYYGDEAGDKEHRRAWLDVRHWLGHPLQELVAVTARLERVLLNGQRDDGLRGTTISKEEYQRLLAKQRRRGAPERLVPQPPYPRGSK